MRSMCDVLLKVGRRYITTPHDTRMHTRSDKTVKIRHLIDGSQAEAATALRVAVPVRKPFLALCEGARSQVSIS